MKAVDAPILRAEIAVLLAKDAIEPVPPADMRSGFYSPYFIVPKKSGGLRPILDLHVLNRALHRLPFKMLTPKRIFGCVRPQDWFAAIDLKDAYFHVSTVPRHRPFLRFAFEGRAYQYKVLPFGLSLSPRVFTKVAEVALGSPSPERTGRAHSQLPRRLAYTSSVSGSVMRTQGLGALAPQPVGPSGQLGKEQTLPDAEWRLHPQTVQLIWQRFGLAQVDLFASLETSHCQLFYSLTEGTLGTDALAHSWPRGLRKYAFPPVSLLAQTLCKVREEEEQVLLVAPYWPTRTWFPELMLLVTAPPWQIPLRKDLPTQRRGTLWCPDLWKLPDILCF